MEASPGRDRARVDLLQSALRARGELDLEAEGDSMRPAIRSGQRITVSLAAPGSLKVGDIVQILSGAETLVHRIVRIGPEGLLLTKGDGLLIFDAPVRGTEVLGRVTAVEGRPPRAGRLLALLSCLQGTLYLWTMRNPLGRRLGELKFRFVRRSLVLSFNTLLGRLFR